MLFEGYEEWLRDLYLSLLHPRSPRFRGCWMLYPLIELRIARARTGSMQGVQKCKRGRRLSRGRVLDDWYAGLHIGHDTVIPSMACKDSVATFVHSGAKLYRMRGMPQAFILPRRCACLHAPSLHLLAHLSYEIQDGVEEPALEVQ
jgi:hypothetical protein